MLVGSVYSPVHIEQGRNFNVGKAALPHHLAGLFEKGIVVAFALFFQDDRMVGVLAQKLLEWPARKLPQGIIQQRYGRQENTKPRKKFPDVGLGKQRD